MKKHLHYLGSVSLAACLFASPAYSQDAGESADSSKGGIADIVVTAQKYEQKLQETPLSIVAVDGSQLVSMGVESLSGFDSFVPNVSIGGTMGQGNAVAAFSIRGIGGGASGFVTQEGAVGVYVDDILFARPNGALLDLLDVERVEVLRGPQGTLFGRNTAGGAVRYVTKKPQFSDVEGNIKGQIGSRSMFNVSGSLNVPLADNFALRASFAKKSREGFVTRLINGDKAGDENTSVGRVQLRWQPVERLDINLTGDWIRSQDDGSATITRDFSPTDLYPTNVYATTGNAGAIGTSARRLVPASLLPNLPGNVGGYTTAAADIAYYQNQVTDKYTVYGPATPDLNKMKSYSLAGTIAYELTDTITAKSLTSYRNIHQIQNQDFDRTPLPLYALNERIEIEFVTQELQLVGSSFDDRLKWVVGGFYYWDHADDYRRRLGGSALSDSAFANDLSALNPASTGLGLGELEVKSITTKSLAFFGQGTFQVTDALGVTAGLRWTEDQKSYVGFRENRGRVCVNNTTGAITAVGAGCTVGTTRTSVTHPTEGKWQNWSPRFIVDYRWSPDVMTYVSASRGFKGGGFNDTVPTTCAVGDTAVCGLTEFRPETLWTYEAGLRSEMLDNRIRFNLTGFYIKYRDLQIQYIEPGAGGAPPIQYTLNGNSTVKGFEAELVAAPTDGLILRASVGYTDSKYDSDVLDGAGTVKIEKTVPYFRSPKWSYTLGANYSVPVRGDDTLAFDVNWGWKDSQASTAIPTNSVIMPSYGLLNGRIEYKADAGWSLAVFGNNLTNAYYYTSAFDPGGPASQASPGTILPHDAVFGFSMLDLGRPREIGVELAYKF